MVNGEPGLRVCAKQCETCLFRGGYPKRTRRAILKTVAEKDSYVACHEHDPAKDVVCRGYWNAYGDRGGTPTQLAWRFEAMGLRVVEWVPPDAYPHPGDLAARDGGEGGG